MTFLIDASLPRSTAATLASYQHTAVDVRDIGLGTASDARIAEYARLNQMALMTGDFDFADIRVYPPERYPGIVVLDRPEHATVRVTLELVRMLLEQTPIVGQLAGRLVIVDQDRIRVRPALG